MRRLLMLEFDPLLVAAVVRTLEQDGIEVVGVSSLAEAERLISDEHFDAALLDAELIEPSSLLLFVRLPLILTTSILEPQGGHPFSDRAHLLRKPFTSAELMFALHEARVVSSARPCTLVDALRQAHAQRQTRAFRIGAAWLFVEKGELVHAELGNTVGEQALLRVLTQGEQDIVPVMESTTQRTIQRPLPTLLLDLLFHIDQREQQSGVLHIGEEVWP